MNLLDLKVLEVRGAAVEDLGFEGVGAGLNDGGGSGGMRVVR